MHHMHVACTECVPGNQCRETGVGAVYSLLCHLPHGNTEQDLAVPYEVCNLSGRQSVCMAFAVFFSMIKDRTENEHVVCSCSGNCMPLVIGGCRHHPKGSVMGTPWTVMQGSCRSLTQPGELIAMLRKLYHKATQSK